jgi:hypothetical protein
MERMISLEARRGRITIQLVATRMGRDLCVALSGGDRPHIGAVALSQARPSLHGDGSLSATTSVLALTGHKEDDLARALAARLAVGLDTTVCVSCGIHVDGIQGEELQAVGDLADELALELMHRLKA